LPAAADGLGYDAGLFPHQAIMASPVFLTGSTLRHVLVMTGASSVGLLAMFGVDVVDLYFLTLLGEQSIVAAVGFSAALLYFLLSLGIGLQIALGALVARSEGGGDRDLAGRYCSSALIFNGALGVVLALLVWWQLPALLTLLGARGETLDYALRYSRIQIPAVPLLVLGMSFGAGLRAVGDARRYMLATVAGAASNACLDPLLIFYFELGIEGAAWASVVSRAVLCLITAGVLFRVHRLPVAVSLRQVLSDVPAILSIGLPAVLTNLATPIGGSLILRLLSEFGDAAVAAQAVLARLAPVAFAAVFAISGAVGPIVGQNAGASRYDRVRDTLRSSAGFILVYIAVMWLLLWLLRGPIIGVFAASPEAESLLGFYFSFLVWAFALNGLLFVSNASFNNLGRPLFATAFNYGKVFLGMLPAAYFLAGSFGARGVLMGEAVGMSVFGALGLFSAFALVRYRERLYPAVALDPATDPAPR
jgi:putative MATE family efflux protein